MTPATFTSLDTGILAEARPHMQILCDQIARVKLARRYALRGEVLSWGRMLFPEKFRLPFCELHEYLVSIRTVDFSSTEAPRGHAKTAIECFLIPMFQALEEPGKFRHYLNVQSTEKKALDVNRSLKIEFETNPLLRALYGNQIGERWTDQQFVLKNGTVFSAIGAGQSIRGINYRNRRPDYVIVDDLYDEEDIYSQESTERKNEWFWGALVPAMAGDRRSMHLQGTAINLFDLMHKLKSAKGVVCRTFKAVLDRDKKTVLWPALRTYDQLMDELENGMPLPIWNRERQNERADDAEAKIKRAWLAGWEFDPQTLVSAFERGSARLLTVILGVDPSVGETKNSDFTGMAATAKVQWKDARLPDFYVLALVNERLSMNERVERIPAVQEALPHPFKIQLCRVEGVGGFSDYGAEVKRRGIIRVEVVKKVPNKLVHLEAKSGLFQNGKVHVSKNIDPRLRTMLFDQLTNNFPANDDVRDGLLQSLDHSKPSLAEIVGKAA